MSVSGVAIDAEQSPAALGAETDIRQEGASSIAQATPSLFLALPVYLLAKLMLLPKEQSVSLLDALRQHGLPGADETGAAVRDAAAALSDFQFQEGLRLTRSALNSFVDAVEEGSDARAAEEFRAFSGMLAAIPWSPKLSLTALAGLVETVLSGNMPEASYLARLRLHNSSDNAFNELAAAVMAERRPVKELPPSRIDHGLLGKATARMAGDALRTSGFHLFEDRLAAGLCDRLETFARKAPVLVVRGDGSSTPAPQAILDDPTVDGCYVDPQHVVDNVDVQKLLMDQGLWTVARDYLGCEPVCVGPNLWWSLPSARPPSDTLAQYHHWDAGWLNWVNIFVYLTDCMGPADGAHVFVRGTHRRGAKPEELRRRFYTRISDEDIVAYHGVENLATLTGPRGTVFAEDTRGWHKGSRPTASSRLILQINFADTLLLSKLFYERKLRLPKNPCTDFARFLAERPEAFSPLYYERA